MRHLRTSTPHRHQVPQASRLLLVLTLCGFLASMFAVADAGAQQQGVGGRTTPFSTPANARALRAATEMPLDNQFGLQQTTPATTTITNTVRTGRVTTFRLGQLKAPRFHHTMTLLDDNTVLVVGGSPSPISERYDPTTGAFGATSSPRNGHGIHTATLLQDGKVLVVGDALAKSTPASAEVYDADTATWSVTGAPSTRRSSHTATRLLGGKVLVVGGNDRTNRTTASAELYDPATGTWSAAGSMATARAFHTATLLPNGKVVVMGGYDLTIHPIVMRRTVEIYDPATNAFTVAATSDRAFAEHTATLLSNGRILIVGLGEDTSTLLYDPATATFQDAAKMNYLRYAPTASLLADGKVLVVGGAFDDGTDPSEISSEIYDPARNTWTLTDELHEARSYHAAVVLRDGAVLVSGGVPSITQLSPVRASAELYRDGAWTGTGVLHQTRMDHTATLLPNGKILVAGGTNQYGDKTAELYDPATGVSTETGKMLVKRADHTATLLPNGKVLIVGGVEFSPNAPSAEVYDPATGQFITTGALKQPRFDATATLLADGKVLITGGIDSVTFEYLRSAELYDPASGTFTLTGNLSVPRRKHTATLLNDGTVLVVGGYSAASIWDVQLASAERYDSATGTFRPTGSLARTRFDHTATSLQNGDVLIYGGLEPEGSALAEVYDAANGTFSTVARLPEQRPLPTLTLLPSGTVMIVGGIFNADFIPSSDIETLEPTTGARENFGALLQNRFRHTATLLPNGQVVVIGGNDRLDVEHIDYTVRNTFTGSLTLPTGWITSTATISFTGSTTDAALNAGAINTGAWLAATPNQPVTTRYFPIQQGRDVAVALRLRDTQSVSTTVVIGRVAVDSLAPVSLMTTLPTMSKPEIDLNWLASDATSGVLNHDVEVRDGKKGAWTPLLNSTTERSITFTGEYGHHYYFRVRSRDIAGNVEPWSSDFDAETEVMPFMPPENRVALPMVRR